MMLNNKPQQLTHKQHNILSRLAKLHPFWYFLAPATAYQTLPVNAFVREYSQWTEYGSDPYLDKDDNGTNMIRSIVSDQVEQYFTFKQCTLKTVDSVILRIDGSGLHSGGIYIYIWNGSAYVKIGEMYWSVPWTMQTLDITSTLNTLAKVNTARLRLISSMSYPGISSCYITYADLYVHGTTR